MAIFLSTQNQVIINGVDLTDHVQKVTTIDERDKVDITAMGATSKVYAKGLGDGGADVDFFQDFSAGKVHATLSPLIASGTGFSFEIRPLTAARSATNPAFLMTALLFTYPMLDGSVGDASMVTVHFDNASQAGVTYPIA